MVTTETRKIEDWYPRKVWHVYPPGKFSGAMLLTYLIFFFSSFPSFSLFALLLLFQFKFEVPVFKLLIFTNKKKMLFVKADEEGSSMSDLLDFQIQAECSLEHRSSWVGQKGSYSRK